MNIRIFKATDYNNAYTLWQATPGMGLNDIDDSREGIEKYLVRNPKTSFVAELDDKIVGTILAGHDGRRGYIYHTCVANEVRKNGIGTKLAETALEALSHEGISKVALVVFKHNERGNAFWEQIEFPTRPDLNYRNKSLIDLNRLNT